MAAVWMRRRVARWRSVGLGLLVAAILLLVPFSGISAPRETQPDSLQVERDTSPDTWVGAPDPPGAQENLANPRVAAPRAIAPPRIDGVLESSWQSAPPISHFQQVSPRSGEPTDYPTLVWMLHDEDALYVAFQLTDPAPEQIAGKIQRRDRNGRSDRVSFGVNPFGDARNGYYFQVTAANVQIDGTVSNVNNFDDTWDGIWQSAVARSDSGWTVEMRIPFTTIRHADPEEHAWTVAFDRYVYRADEWSAWPIGDRNLGMRTDHFAPLTGLTDVKTTSHVEIIPHAVARWDADTGQPWQSTNDWENIGASAKWVIRPRWSLDATFQPDFAQVEVDQAVVNLSDYPVFLSEKRPFFLEGLDLFQQTDIRMLYTRRIADPEVGVRLTGQETVLRSSALYARNVTDDGDREDAFALRTLGHLGGRHTLGATVTHLNRDSLDVSTAAVDGVLRWSRRNQWRATVAASDRPGWRRQPISVQSHLFVAPAPDWETFYEFGYRGRDFHINDLGWGRYSDQIWNWLRVNRRYYYDQGAVEQVNVFLHGYHEMHADGHYPLGNGWTATSVKMRSKWWWGLNGSRGTAIRRDYLDDDELADGLAWDRRDNYGEYRIERHPAWGVNGWFSSDPRALFQFGAGVGHSRLRDGLRVYVDPWLTATPRANLSFTTSLDWTHTWDVSDINAGDPANYRVWRFRADWSPSLPTSLRATFQYVEEPEGDVFGLANIVAAWNWAPGSWLYAVYGEERDATDTLRGTRPGDRTIRLKGTWFVTVG